MRIIKFRAWIKYANAPDRMVFWDNEQFETEWLYQKPKFVELMQFTGLHDKNGKEIYEGDIVNHGDNYPSEIVFDNYQWELREWGYEKEGYKYRTHDLLSYTNPIEVIGNVFENPELAGRTE